MPSKSCKGQLGSDREYQCIFFCMKEKEEKQEHLPMRKHDLGLDVECVGGCGDVRRGSEVGGQK